MSISKKEKDKAIIKKIIELNKKGQPVSIGNMSVSKKEKNNISHIVRKEQDILPKMFFEKLSAIVNGNNFQWYFNESNLDSTRPPFLKNKNFMFTHMFFNDKGASSGWFDTFEPILYFINDKVKVNELLRMKLNLYTNQNKRVMYGTHCDRHDDKGKPFKDVNTAILNFTTCNGGTKIGNKIYKSKANELLIFNNTIKHAGIVQTDTQTRLILNIDWR